MSSDPLFLLAALSALVALADLLARKTVLRHLGTALLVIVLTALVANLGLIPVVGAGAPFYDWVLGDLAQLAIFWLLLQVHLKELRRAGGPMITCFSIGCIGTLLGVLAGSTLLGSELLGEHRGALMGMFVATYTGGSVNFNTVAVAFDVTRDGALYAGAAAVDSAMTTMWMAVTLAVPRLMGVGRGAAVVLTPSAGDEDTDTVHPADLAVLIALGAATLFLARHAAASIAVARPDWPRWSESVLGVVLLTTTALILAQVPAVRALRGGKALGMLAVYLFLAGIGALCDVAALASLGEIALPLTFFVCVTLAVHGVLVFGAARALRLEPDVAAVASQAGIGGSTSALALARSLGRPDLVLPAILVGSLGTAIGTYMGVLAAGLLG
jgi:uncharacterized membrane protein